jgi:CRP/FNR family transcriptional regulator, cyclic AMP receptor protein
VISGSSPASLSASLRDTWFGERLPESALARLETHCRTVSYEAGAEILREGDQTTDLGIVIRGRVAIRLRVPERGPTTILTVEEGSIIGWSAVVTPHRATSTVVALVPTDLLLLDGAGLRAELDADPILAAVVYQSLLEALAHRLTGTRMQLLDLFSQQEDEPW